SGATSSVSDNEMRRLADVVRALAADRDRLAARVSALERNLDDVTGSIPKRPGSEAATPGASPLPPSPPPQPPPATPAAASPVPPPRGRGAAPPRGPGAPHPGPTPADAAATGSTATRTEFGIDLGTAATVEGLRNLWSSIKGTQAPLVEGLRPVVAVRDG